MSSIASFITLFYVSRPDGFNPEFSVSCYVCYENFQHPVGSHGTLSNGDAGIEVCPDHSDYLFIGESSETGKWALFNHILRSLDRLGVDDKKAEMERGVIVKGLGLVQCADLDYDVEVKISRGKHVEVVV